MRAWRRPRLDSCHRRAGGRKRLRRHFAFAGLPGIRSPARRKWSHGLPCEEFRLVRGDSLILMTLSGLGEWLPSGLRDYVLAPERACVDEDYKVFPTPCCEALKDQAPSDPRSEPKLPNKHFQSMDPLKLDREFL